MAKMTKKQALKEFREHVAHRIPKHDRVARAEAWSNYTDGLERSGLITRRQCDTWVNPF